MQAQGQGSAGRRPAARPTRATAAAIIVLFTDYGWRGPYTGQLRLVLARLAPGVPVIELMADAPACRPRAAAYLLAAVVDQGVLPDGAIVLAVVDPGVGSDRAGVVVTVDGRSFVGPDNGLFELVCRRASRPPAWTRLPPPPSGAAATFHGRDVFAPAAARLATLGSAGGEPVAEGRRFSDWPDDWPAIIQIDGFGNAITGIRAARWPAAARVVIGGRPLPRARTFADVARGEAFCYANSLGLIEIAVNGGRADQYLDLTLDQEIAITSS